MKRTPVIFLLLCLLFYSASAAAAESLSVMGYESEPDRSWSDNVFFQRSGEKLGLSFTFQAYTQEDAYQQAKDDAFAQGTLPDILFKANLTPQEEMRYLQSGQLVDLAPYLAEHAPTIYTILQTRGDWRAAVTQPGGAIASLPVLTGLDRQCCIWINQGWLDTLGLSMPASIDAFTEVLRAFRDGDPNGNGKADEIPLSLMGTWEAKFLLHAWGLTPNDYNLYTDDAGTVRYAPQQAEFRDFVQWLQLALQEGLINSDVFRSSQATRSALRSAESDAALVDGSVISIAPYTLIDLDLATQYVVVPPLQHNGQQVYRQLLNGVGRGAFAITSACQNIPAALQWVDYLYTEEGGRLAFAGLEGEEYIIRPDGTWHWQADGDYQWVQDLVNLRIIAGDANTPGLEPAAFMRNTEIAADNHVRRQTDSLQPYLVQPFPVFWPTDEARLARIEQLHEQLAVCVDTAIAEFAMGVRPLTDEGWADFMQALDELGVAEFIALWQDIYNEI